MTVSYQIGRESFRALLLRWRGSLWQSVFKELLVWLSLFFVVSFIYRFALDDPEKRTFERWVVSFETATAYIPVQFTLGFYVASVYTRFWQQFSLINGPEKFVSIISLGIRGEEPVLVALRRCLSRYLNLSNALGWRFLSTKVFKRFPTDYHFVNAGMMTDLEFHIFRRSQLPPAERYLVPLLWIIGNLVRAKRQGLIEPEYFREATKEIARIKDCMLKLHNYSWVTPPLVYTQVVTIAVYGYFALGVVSRQFTKIDPAGLVKDPLDWYFPVFSTLQFLFYVGWLKVGEQVFDPFGEDDIDFEMNHLIDRNLQVSFAIAESVVQEAPPVGDSFGGTPSYDIQIPRTKASLAKPDIIAKGSVAHIKLKLSEMELTHESTLTQSI